MLVLATVVLTAALVGSLIWGFRVRGEGENSVHELSSLRSQKRELLQKLEQRQFVSRFIGELSLLTEQLHSRVKTRRIPEFLLQVLVRAFEPRQAVVLLRRRNATSQPGRDHQLTVAAVHPENSSVKTGTEIAMGESDLGVVAEAQITMTRAEFERETTLSRQRGDPLKNFKPSMAAPMVFNGETMGVVAFSGSPYEGLDAKKALWLIAQTGAVALHNVAAYSEMKFTADMDGLTRIYNKRHMVATLGEKIFQAEKQVSKVSIFLFDIDNFKNYNDLNGHVAGDQLLRELAALVKQNIREENVFGRFGGEEFLVLLPGAATEDAMVAAENIRGLIANHPFDHAERQPLGIVSVSGGVATFPTDALDSTSLLRTADEALYASKHQGRNRVNSNQQKYMCEGQSATPY